MSLLLWNCRGLGKPLTENELVRLIQEKDLSVVFIAETWTDEIRLDRTLSKINFDQKWVVLRLNRGGGLALFWKSSINIEVVDSHRYYIDTIINGNTEDAWRFTGFYGKPETHRRSEAWNKLRSLNARMNIPWICGGDFNEIVRHDEKWVGHLEIIIKCNYSEMWSMNVVSWIWDMWGQSSLGQNIMLMGTP